MVPVAALAPPAAIVAIAEATDSTPRMDMGGMAMPEMRATASVQVESPMAMATGPVAGGVDGSGTSWEPAALPMRMLAWKPGGWNVRVHGRIQGGYDFQGSDRGKSGPIANQNWQMVMADHPDPVGDLELRVMTSLEPGTIGSPGEPQLFQTGEAYQGAPLLDLQHPHNLLMEAAARYTVRLGDSASVFAYGAPVGEPALGPTAFMHRASAGENPWAPLSHHLQDSTHISAGVATLGATWKWFKVDASLFNAREPGDDKWLPPGLLGGGKIADGPLDSYSGRLTFAPSPDWAFQFSSGHLVHPEASPGAHHGVADVGSVPRGR